MITYDQYTQFSPYFAQLDVEKAEDRSGFLKLFQTLSKLVKELLVSMETSEKIINIGKTFGLDEFDTEALSFVVRKIVTGEVFIGYGAEFVAREVGLPPERSKSLLSLLVNEIFAPALEDIKEIQTAKFSQQFRVSAQSKTPTKRLEPPQTSNDNVINLRNRQN